MFILKVAGEDAKYLSHFTDNSDPVFTQSLRGAYKHDNLAVLDDLRLVISIENGIKCHIREYIGNDQ